jgi:hypothetical protein
MDQVDEAVRKVVAAVTRQRKQSLAEAIGSGWRARDEVITAAHELKDAYDKRILSGMADEILSEITGDSNE